MSNYIVYEHSEYGNRAVKKDFLWLAFFFHFFWCIWNRIWVAAFILLFYSVCVESIGVIIELAWGAEALHTFTTLKRLVFVAICVFIGSKARKWVGKKWIKDGYVEKATVSATSKEEAIKTWQTDSQAV